MKCSLFLLLDHQLFSPCFETQHTIIYLSQSVKVQLSQFLDVGDQHEVLGVNANHDLVKTIFEDVYNCVELGMRV